MNPTSCACRLVVRVSPALVLAMAVMGCGEATLAPTLGAGADCIRTAQCDTTQGLACIGNICTTDLSGLAEAGTVPMLFMDGGAAPMVDGGMAATDGGMMMMRMDGGMMMGMDSGPPPVMDSGPPPVMDAGPPPVVDGGMAGTDGG